MREGLARVATRIHNKLIYNKLRKYYFNRWGIFGIGTRIGYTTSVFHRILDLKTGWISIRAFFFVLTRACGYDRRSRSRDREVMKNSYFQPV